jgi:DNA-nicking Smr family endonuclease
MARKKKKKKIDKKKHGGSKGPKVFNSAFNDLADLKKKKPGSVEAPEKKAPSEEEMGADDDRYFLSKMSDVAPLSPGAEKIVIFPSEDLSPARPVRNEDMEAIAHLCDLVSGSAEMDITFSDEYIEGSVKGFDRKLMQKLKKGQFPIQDYVDLHGMIKQDAEVRVRDFLQKSQRQGFRCVLVVHGKGLNSENHIPVIKEQIPLWLSRGPVRKIILAFSTAMPYDGGTGAIYILLKRPAGRL